MRRKPARPSLVPDHTRHCPTPVALFPTTKIIDGEEAARIGMAMEAVNSEDVVPNATKLAQRIAAASTNAVRGLVETLR